MHVDQNRLHACPPGTCALSTGSIALNGSSKGVS
jgi:hypothetical protein